MDLPLDSDLAESTRRTAELLTAIAIRAGAAILRFDCRNVSTRHKADEFPVTLADEAAQAVILRGLAEGFPGVPVVSEEADRPRSRPAPRSSWSIRSTARASSSPGATNTP